PRPQPPAPRGPALLRQPVPVQPPQEPRLAARAPARAQLAQPAPAWESAQPPASLARAGPVAASCEATDWQASTIAKKPADARQRPRVRRDALVQLPRAFARSDTQFRGQRVFTHAIPMHSATALAQRSVAVHQPLVGVLATQVL